MATNGNKQPPSTGALIAIGLTIALLSAVSSFVAIRFAMPRQIIVEKVEGEKAQPKEEAKAVPTTQLPIGEFIVNLSDTGVRRYLRTSITLEMQEGKKVGLGPRGELACGTGGGAAGGGEGIKVASEEGPKAAPAYLAIYKDVIIDTLSRKTVSEITSLSGKERLKDELRELLNQRVPDEVVVAVYFTDFVIQ